MVYQHNAAENQRAMPATCTTASRSPNSAAPIPSPNIGTRKVKAFALCNPIFSNETNHGQKGYDVPRIARTAAQHAAGDPGCAGSPARCPMRHFDYERTGQTPRYAIRRCLVATHHASACRMARAPRRWRRVSQTTIGGMMSHCRSGLSPVPKGGTSGIRSEYVQRKLMLV